MYQLHDKLVSYKKLHTYIVYSCEDGGHRLQIARLVLLTFVCVRPGGLRAKGS